MSIIDLFWLFFMLSALQPVLRQQHDGCDAHAQDRAARARAEIAASSSWCIGRRLCGCLAFP